MSHIYERDGILYMKDEAGDEVEVPTRREFVDAAIAVLREKYDGLTTELPANPNPDTASKRKSAYSDIMQLGRLLNSARA